MTPQLLREITDLITPQAPRRPLEGWCVLEKARELAELVLKVRPMCVVEMGVFGGRSLIPQALALRENGSGLAFGVDTWSSALAIENFDRHNPDDAKQLAWWATIDMHEIYRGCAKTIDDLKLDDFCALIRARSEFAAQLFALESIDVLHIDGDHQEISSCRDVGLWLPRVRRGGHIWFDDTNWPQTQSALRLLDGECSLVREMTVGESQWRLYRKRD
jgi:predicted O-methyltransferase YrrM